MLCSTSSPFLHSVQYLLPLPFLHYFFPPITLISSLPTSITFTLSSFTPPPHFPLSLHHHPSFPSLPPPCFSPFSSNRVYSADFKMEIYLKISRLYLEEEDHVSAEAYIKRASLLLHEVTNKDLTIVYKVMCVCLSVSGAFLCVLFVYLCALFVNLCIFFVYLCALFVNLCIFFVYLCALFVNHCIFFVYLCALIYCVLSFVDLSKLWGGGV